MGRHVKATYEKKARCADLFLTVFYSSPSVMSLDFHEIPFITHRAEEVFCKRQVVDSLEWDRGREGE